MSNPPGPQSVAAPGGGPGKVLVYCHAGCDTETHVLPALSLTWADLFDTRGGIKIDTVFGPKAKETKTFAE